MIIDKKAVGKRIYMIRHRLGLNMEEFGIKVDKALKSNVSKWERGDSLPNNSRIKIIAELGEMSIDELLYGSIHEKYSSLIEELKEKLTLEYIDVKSKVLKEDFPIVANIIDEINREFFAESQNKLDKYEGFSLIDLLEYEKDYSGLENMFDSISKRVINQWKNPETRTTAVLKNITEKIEQEIENIDNVMMKKYGTKFVIQTDRYQVKDGINQNIYNKIRDILTETHNKLEKIKEEDENGTI